jgi:hypothetical protein
MLSDSKDSIPRTGSLSRDIKLGATFTEELLTFIAYELPRWRDRSDRPQETAETRLTAQLCSHLNSVARRTKGWDILQFKQEEPDPTAKGRTLDLTAAACDATLWVEGRRYIEFDTLLPIECKRLPTPLGTDRDEREYVFSQHTSTGGIQRYKAGHHAAKHELAAMVGYIQYDTCEFWNHRVSEWIDALIKSKEAGWTSADHVKLKQTDLALKTAVLHSSHTRTPSLPSIELRHLWIEMG